MSSKFIVISQTNAIFGSVLSVAAVIFLGLLGTDFLYFFHIKRVILSRKLGATGLWKTPNP